MYVRPCVRGFHVRPELCTPTSIHAGVELRPDLNSSTASIHLPHEFSGRFRSRGGGWGWSGPGYRASFVPIFQSRTYNKVQRNTSPHTAAAPSQCNCTILHRNWCSRNPNRRKDLRSFFQKLHQKEEGVHFERGIKFEKFILDP